MAKYQKYAEYKDSGIEWLGEIPSHWKVTKLKFLAKIKNGQDYKHVEAEKGFPVMGSGGQFTFSTEFMFDQPSVLLGRKGTIDKPLFIDEPFWTVDTMYYTDVQKDIDVKYFYYLAKIILFDRYSTNTALPSMTQENLNNFEFSIPCDFDERLAIRKFLDYETAKIDTLIAKQEKLIELLKEKRQAVISHAVTKGLNPNVKMKDSGVEWLGEVPEHWKLVPLKYLCSFSGGGTPTKDNLTYWTNGNIPWVSPKDMKTFLIKETQDYITEKAVKESSTNMVEPNSLLIVVRSGILQRTIPIAINIVPVTMNQDMKALKFGQRILVEYVANLIHGNTQQLLLEWSKEGATVESIEHEYLANSIIPVPPIEEQEEIIQHIDNELKLFKQLENNANKAIQLMQERRTALISAAVTGKIDVRHHASRIMGNDKMQTEVV
ncbi:restriction endonuclease subunit S [Acinetobacter baumannii]|uniref:restriction endonuclease subunit S n=1 Tax=Acinetobacter baumannii TaxID=470 RepID=UPI00244955C5|nr:restriction endonuclease subunit S [Acinetobacter baumannii]MDH2521103.1 restriction endonuclease subunit S [Acinetobacter baumannii]